MARILVLDTAGNELLSLRPGKGLGTYIRAAATLRSIVRTPAALDTPLTDIEGERSLALALDADVPLGAGSFGISGGARVEMAVRQAGSAVLDAPDLHAPVLVPPGMAATTVAIDASVKATATVPAGAASFGFRAGTGVRYTFAALHDTLGGDVPSLRAALATMLEQAVIPLAIEDLERLPANAVVSLAGEGELSFSAEVPLGAATNLLATPGLPLVGTATVRRSASMAIGAEWSAQGDVELRVSRRSPTTVRLEYYRRRGRSLTVTAHASAGLALDVQGRDLLALLMKAISDDPETDLLALVNAGLSDQDIRAIEQAIAASVDRSLTMSAQLGVSALAEDEALFGYDIDLSQLDADGRGAVGEALGGRLHAIERLAGAGGAVTAVASAAARLRSRRTSWRVNLFGILNVASFVELVKTGTTTFDPITGAFNAADHVTGRRIGVVGKPLESDPEKLHRVLFESLMVTAAYQAARALGTSLTLTARHVYVEQRGRTKRRELEEHYRALIALGLCDAAERDARLGDGAEFGASMFVLQNELDAAACDAMFLDATGQPHPELHYERIARSALRALLSETDPTESFRRSALESELLWRRVRAQGTLLESDVPGLSLAQRSLVRGDVVTVLWWADAMHGAGRALLAMRTFLAGRDAAALRGDDAFARARKALENALAGMVQQTGARFDDPWDVLAMDGASHRRGTMEGVVVSSRFAVRYADEEPPPAPVARARGPLGTVGAQAAAAGAGQSGGARDWTAEELAVFSRHVVNLGKGKLSSVGSFTSSPEQVREIFTQWIPEYLAAQDESGATPRVLFFAHGGLVDEREGLRPVLARRRFWEANGVYPVYFVWETGIRETLRDILDGVVPRARGPIGDLADVAIEHAAHRARAVWGQMTQNAEAAARAGGGSRLVAQLARELWASRSGPLEYHAVGHSAGAILHAHFLPLLVAAGPGGSHVPDVRSLHLLAPAATLETFKARLAPLVGRGKPITTLTMYTMTDAREQDDASVRPYGKSLLYLVSRGFEETVPTPLVGMEASLKRDLDAIRFFGLAGTQKVADVVFSTTMASAPPDARSQSITHGGFDNDVATMTSVVRRVLGVPTGPVVEYFEDAVPGFSKAAVGIPPEGIRAVASGTRAAAGAARSAAPGGSRKPWTVMVWMAGDNDLEDFGDTDLGELKRVGSNEHVNVVAQFDSMRDDRTRRYFLTKGSGSPERDAVEELGETNTGDPAVAIDFFRWAIERYPADRLLAVIWNHGSGIDEQDVYARAVRSGGAVVRGAATGQGTPERRLVRTALSGRHRRALFSTTVDEAIHERAIAYDDTNRDFLDNLELKRVLGHVTRQTGRTIDVLGFDACLMNMIEVAYQMRGTASVIVGSEELEPGEGWPYHRVLEAIVSDPAITPAALGAAIVNAYVKSYRSGSITQSALALARVDTVKTAVDALAGALRAALARPAEYAAVTRALHAAQRFDTPDYVDLGSLCTEIASRSAAAAVKKAARAVVNSLSGPPGFILAEGHKGSGVAGATGIAIYFPRGPVAKAYRRLDFARSTAGWRGFLEAYERG